jgi:hypothetical protein
MSTILRRACRAGSHRSAWITFDSPDLLHTRDDAVDIAEHCGGIH